MFTLIVGVVTFILGMAVGAMLLIMWQWAGEMGDG